MPSSPPDKRPINGRGHWRIGIDLGGTKIEGILLSAEGNELARKRIASPQNSYRDTISAVSMLVADLVSDAGQNAAGSDHAGLTVGIGIPGSISPSSRRIQNANSTWLNGKPFDSDLSQALPYPVRLENDANCFALSEATDGAGRAPGGNSERTGLRTHTVFGVILGTGVGGGIVINGRIVNGPRATGGEWGHNPLPWPLPGELPGPRCWCGRNGCLEAWLSGPALSADHFRVSGKTATAEDIGAQAAQGDRIAMASLDRHCERLARGLATVANVIDPDVIVLGGGLSKLPHLYDELPGLIASLLFSDCRDIVIKPPKWGDASGVRGAAWLFE